ncbi:TatD DNase [Clonorchis sinensis]|uniref:Deoxyribonuclease TATDN1 n=2 Tax=Clonorchis sinensis TaxID=79923 RepID=A0A8T1MYB0_CLOSI|nr:TatD DNase [Clonorchis sinensis]
MVSVRKFIDIGANLTDKVFRGLYRGRQHHEDDFQIVLSRAFSAGIDKIIVTTGSLSDAEDGLALTRTDERLYATAGCHPTRCQEFEPNPEQYLSNLRDLILRNRDKIVAVGECGLDYDREEFCPAAVQREHFAAQLRLASEVNLPLFLHCRAAHDDLAKILAMAKEVHFNGHRPLRGVVHTFDGTLSDAERILALGLYLGLNGCSLKTEENLQVVKSIPVDRILLETDAPWCEIRPTHAGYKYISTHHPTRKSDRWDAFCMVKGRNEPANIVQVLEVVAAVKSLPADELAEQIFQNTMKLFYFPANNPDAIQ